MYVFNQNASVSYSCNLYYGTIFLSFRQIIFGTVIDLSEFLYSSFCICNHSKKAHKLLATYDVYIIQLYNVYTPIAVLKYLS